MNWTPYQINIILHYHCGAGPWPQFNAPIFPETMSRLEELGLVQQIHGGAPALYRTTDKGKALIAMWSATPLPEMRYVDPRFEEIAQ